MKDTVIIGPISDVTIDLRAREWCKLPYPDHPRGCPNYGKKDTCPPKAPIWADVMDGPYFLVGVRFDLGAWAAKMREKHPKWSDRQARCCLYWQGTVRRKLRAVCKEFENGMKKTSPNLVTSYCPEAMGVHVFETCRKVGIQLLKNPSDFVWKVAIIGVSKSKIGGLLQYLK